MAGKRGSSISDSSPTNRAAPAVDPQGRLGLVVAALLGLVVACGHMRPAMVWPMEGLWLAGAVALLAALAGLIAWRGDMRLGGLGAPSVLLTVFVIWAWLRTRASTVPTEGFPAVGAFVVGIVFFWLGAFVVRGVASPRHSDAEPGRFGLHLVAGFYALLALALALHAIAQYHLLYPMQLRLLIESGQVDLQDFRDEGIVHALTIRRVSSWFGNPNVLCGFLAMCLPLGAAFGWEWLRRPSKENSWAIGSIVTLWGATLLYAAFRTGSAGGALVMALGVVAILGAAILAKKRQGGSGGSRLAPFVGILGLLLLLFGFETVSQTPSLARSDPNSASLSQEGAPRPSAEKSDAGSLLAKVRQVETIRQRILYGRSAWNIWLRAPWTGHGVGAYERLYASARLAGAQETRYVHNFPLQLLVETGLVGLGLFAAFLAVLAWRFVQAVRSGWGSAGLLGAGAAMGLFLFDSLGDLTFYDREVYLDFCLLSGAFCASAPTRSRCRFSTWLALGSIAIAAPLVVLAARETVYKPLLAKYYLQMTSDLSREIDFAPEAERRYVLALRARDAVDRALRAEPENPRVWQESANLYARGGETQKAIEQMQTACRLHPLSASMRAEMAQYKWRLGERDAAMALVDEAIALNPLESTHHEQRARFLADMDRPGEALASARRATQSAFTPLEKRSSAATLRELEARSSKP